MPDLLDVLTENNDLIECLREYLKKMYDKTNRNIIVYYSGWLTAPNNVPNGINDLDKNSFMSMVHGLGFDKGLDIILHTPGGSVAATESLIYYLHEIFGNDIRDIVPQLAMSGGTMMACSCKEIIMGKQSSLGPIDPQFNGIPAQAVLTEFERAKDEIKKDPSSIPLWQMIISKYDPTFLDSCQKAIEWSEDILKFSLENYMFEDNCDSNIEVIMNVLGSHSNTKAHDRHLSPKTCQELGLNVSMMEDDDELQEIILSIHNYCMGIFYNCPTFKIFANNHGKILKQDYAIDKN